MLVGVFSSINESVWEHLKLLFFPMLITTIIGLFYYGDTIPNYLCAKVKGILVAMVFIIIFFYTYTGIIGKNIAILDVGSFFVAVILGQYYSYRKTKLSDFCNTFMMAFILLLLLFAFLIFTFFPPDIGIFRDTIPCMVNI